MCGNKIMIKIKINLDPCKERRLKMKDSHDEVVKEEMYAREGLDEDAEICEIEGLGREYDEDIDDDDIEEVDEDEKLSCAVCGKELHLFTKKKVTKGLYICGDCEEKSAVHRYKKEMRKLSPEEALRIVLKKIEKAENFKITKSIDGFLLIDGPKRLWTVPYAIKSLKKIPRIDPALIFSFDAIQSYELFENGNCMAKGGLGMPPIGGLLFGEDGDGFSANSEEKDICESLQIRVNLRNVSVPKIFINLIFKEIDKEKKAYGSAVLTAQKILSAFENIIRAEEKDEQKARGAAASPADEIKKYKELLDMGAISPEEYEKKKNELLNM